MWQWIDYLPGDFPSDSTASDDNSEYPDENKSEDEGEDGSVDDINSECESGSGSEESVDPYYLVGGPISGQVKDMINECVRLGQLPDSYQDCHVSYFEHCQYNKTFLLSPADFEEPEASNILLRIAKPIVPYFKTESEVASLCFAKDQGVPVPEVY